MTCAGSPTIVSSGVESPDLIINIVKSSQHKDNSRRLRLSEFFENCPAVIKRQNNVENNQIELTVLSKSQSLFCIIRDLNSEYFCSECFGAH